MSATPTARPWALTRTTCTHNHPTRRWETLVSSDCGIVAAAMGETHFESDANARLIVTAVNHHEALVDTIRQLEPLAVRMQAACDSGETYCYDNEYDQRDADEYLKVVQRARQLLARLDGAERERGAQEER